MEDLRAKERREIAGLVFAAVLGILPWLLDKIGIDMPKQAYVFLLCLSITLGWWALASLGWLEKIPFINGRQTSLSTTIISCIAIGAMVFTLDATLREPKAYFSDDISKFKTISHHKFANERVPLDGIEYINCDFENVTFEYHGTTVIRFSDNNIYGSTGLSLNGATLATVGLLKGIGWLRTDIPILAGPEKKLCTTSRARPLYIRSHLATLAVRSLYSRLGERMSLVSVTLNLSCPFLKRLGLAAADSSFLPLPSNGKSPERTK